MSSTLLHLVRLAAGRLGVCTTLAAVVVAAAVWCAAMPADSAAGRPHQPSAGGELGTALVVRAPTPFSSHDPAAPRPRLDASLADLVRAVDGVEAAAPEVHGWAQVVGRDGRPVPAAAPGAPSVGAAWMDDARLSPFRLVAGTPPATADQVVIDPGTARRGHLQPGDDVDVLAGSGRRHAHVSGVAALQTPDRPDGAAYVLFPPAIAAGFVAVPGRADSIAVAAAPGIDLVALATKIHLALPVQVDVDVATQVIAEDGDVAVTRPAISRSVGSTFLGDDIVTTDPTGGARLSAPIVDDLAALDVVTAVLPVRRVRAEIGGVSAELTGADPGALASLVDLGTIRGSIDDVDDDGIAMSERQAAAMDRQVGDIVSVVTADSGVTQFVLRAIYTHDELIGPYLIGERAFDRDVADGDLAQVLVATDHHVDPGAATAAIRAAIAMYPTARLHTTNQGDPS